MGFSPEADSSLSSTCFLLFSCNLTFFFHIRLSDSRLLKCLSLRGNSLESWASTVRLPPYFLRWSCRLEILYNVYLYSKMGAGQHADSMQVSNRRLPCAGWWGHSMLACFRNPVVIFHANFFFFSTQSTGEFRAFGRCAQSSSILFANSSTAYRREWKLSVLLLMMLQSLTKRLVSHLNDSFLGAAEWRCWETTEKQQKFKLVWGRCLPAHSLHMTACPVTTVIHYYYY